MQSKIKVVQNALENNTSYVKKKKYKLLKHQ